ncbi:hypothetical protein BFS14_15410 [Serratia fonticola]|uniref:fimbrial protein n=1 Tax=Serratia fonticola TaxID=47917 RepID=UPI0008FD2BA3|nr:hypothetical protein BFS14_15410 [Serratia fonticola]
MIGRCFRAARSFGWRSVLFLLPVYATSVNSQENVHFYGALTADACVIPPGKELISLEFGTVSSKFLYKNQRTQGHRFELNLADCDLSIGKMVKITFLATESLGLPGLLALSDDSEAKGIAIGLETLGKKLVPVNNTSEQYELQVGTNVISLYAFIQGEPDAIVNKRIREGGFKSTAMIELNYE